MLFELEDKAWFPIWMRSMQTDFIGWMVRVMGVYDDVASEFDELVERTHATKVVDLCSGSGEPAMVFSRKNRKLTFILTDLYPDTSRKSKENVGYLKSPFNCLDMQHEMANENGVYLMFNAFHHFNEQQKQKIIAHYGAKGILVCEILQRNIFEGIKIFLTTTLVQIITAPFVQPFSIKRIIFTWIIPINIMTVTWDGIVSVLRADKKKEFYERAIKCAPPHTEIRHGSVGPFYARVYFFSIIPLNKNDKNPVAI